MKWNKHGFFYICNPAFLKSLAVLLLTDKFLKSELVIEKEIEIII